MKTASAIRNCLITSAAGTDLTPLAMLLHERGVNILDLADYGTGALSLAETVLAAVRRADLVVGVLTSALSRDNVLFELGCAYALGKQILLVVAPGTPIPSDLYTVAHVNSLPDDHEAVDFALDQILHAPRPSRIVRAPLRETGRPLGDLADDLLTRLDSLGDSPSESAMLSFVHAMLTASGVSILAQSPSPDSHPDFAVWVDELEPYLGNPLLIEVKRRITNPGKARATADQVLRSMEHGNARAALVLVAEQSDTALSAVPAFPHLFFFDLRAFVERLREKSFAKILRDERNARVHGRIG